MKHELSSMKAFVILAESSSFNNAAKLLNITQPALTRRIKKMEEDLCQEKYPWNLLVTLV